MRLLIAMILVGAALSSNAFAGDGDKTELPHQVDVISRITAGGTSVAGIVSFFRDSKTLKSLRLTENEAVRLGTRRNGALILSSVTGLVAAFGANEIEGATARASDNLKKDLADLSANSSAYFKKLHVNESGGEQLN